MLIYDKLTAKSRAQAKAQESLREEIERTNKAMIAYAGIEAAGIARKQQAFEKIVALQSQEKQLADIRKQNAGAEARLIAIAYTVRRELQKEHSDQRVADIEKWQAKRQAILSSLQKQREIERSSLAADKARLANLASEIKSRQQAAEVAKQALQTEKERTQSIKAQIGALSSRDKKELERLAKKIEGGGSLTSRELGKFSRIGGKDAQKYARDQYIQREGGLSDLVARSTTGQGLDAATRKKRAVLGDASASLKEKTGGGSAEDALEAIKLQGEGMGDAFKTFLDKNTTLLTKAINKQEALSQKIDALEGAQYQ